MKATAFLFETDRFAIEWPDDPDASAPPGHALADALLRELLKRGATSVVQRVPDDWWEHGNWFFAVDWGDTRYDVRVECGPGDRPLGAWAVSASKMLGCLRALFGRHEARYEVDDEFLDLLERCIIEVTAAQRIERLAADDAYDRLWAS
ncbi:MAG: hypothetical protein GC159_24290 [Phycisphaera sp.]|nr:hypothetical protein [Phycisphaera sp.]